MTTQSLSRNFLSVPLAEFRSVATLLAVFDIPESAVRNLLEARIASRLERDK